MSCQGNFTVSFNKDFLSCRDSNDETFVGRENVFAFNKDFAITAYLWEKPAVLRASQVGQTVPGLKEWDASQSRSSCDDGKSTADWQRLICAHTAATCPTLLLHITSSPICAHTAATCPTLLLHITSSLICAHTAATCPMLLLHITSSPICAHTAATCPTLLLHAPVPPSVLTQQPPVPRCSCTSPVPSSVLTQQPPVPCCSCTYGKYGKNRSRTENVTERTWFSKSRSNDLEDIGQGQTPPHTTHLLMLVIICTKYGKNPSRTVHATERTRFSRSRPNDLENIGQGQRSLHATHPLMLMMICAKYVKNVSRIVFFSRWKPSN